MNDRLQTGIVRTTLESLGFIVRQEVPLGQGIWRNIRVDFVVDGIGGYPNGLVIECKWQEVRGSADEKIAYTVLNIKEHYPIPAILICSGGENAKALWWAKTQIGGNLIAAFNTDEFIAWAGKLRPGRP